jgi:DNA polymerase III subunit gamma/tau
LVCKDEKVANLLEVVESFKDKYISAAKKTSASYIISALNLLNDAEITYKQARNKRLHVELALIKLTYLQQALDLTDKKKVVEKTKAVQFRALKPIEVKEQADGTRNKVQDTSGAKLIVEEPVQRLQETRNKVQEANPAIQNPTIQTAAPKTASAGIKGGLSKLREKIAAENNNPNNQQKEIDPEGLKIAWQEYILKLKAATKHSVVSTFEMMECHMRTPLDFEVVVYGSIQLGFLKQEKTALLQHVQAFFKNPNINILVQLMEEPEDLTPVERPLSTKEQFIRMAEKYPLIKDLKDRLGLELDY